MSDLYEKPSYLLELNQLDQFLLLNSNTQLLKIRKKINLNRWNQYYIRIKNRKVLSMKNTREKQRIHSLYNDKKILY